ncbi:helix-turn-helix domain-containing protein [Aurantimonas sp. C2-6-R+9]|uniref:helix-turn-helix domain-containing protein n=1 Tax=unclassified Aurantimonas TaxID=2638230 RepID=UPI002E19E232|nr:helix-turn-helix domain-containing protein [Aurantimonas sp. C2-6-R+9]
MKNNTVFIGLPPAAMADTRLSACDFRVLMAIASHDRLGRNGRGCFASVGTLAGEARCAIRAAERSISHLKICGYVKSSAREDDRRQRVYRVAYDESTTDKSVGETEGDHRQNRPKSPPDFQKTAHKNQMVGGGKHMKHIVSNGEPYAEETASFLQNADFLDREIRRGSQNLGGWLAQVGRYIPHASDDELGRMLKELEVIVEAHSDFSDPNAGWAERLLIEIGDRIDTPDGISTGTAG